MALTKFTDTLIRGFQTSPNGAVSHHRCALRVNNAVDAFEALNRDKSRTKSEKAAMYKELQQHHGAAIRKDLERFERELVARADHHAEQEQKILDSVSTADAIAIVVGLRAAGLSSDQMLTAMHDSRDVAVSLARVPSVLSGMDSSVAVRGALAHYPNMVEAEAELERDYSAYKSLERVVDRTITTIGLSVDEQVLAERFDEAALKPTPDPVSMAEQNSMLGEAANPNKEAIERFDGKIAGYHARQGDKPTAY